MRRAYPDADEPGGDEVASRRGAAARLPTMRQRLLHLVGASALAVVVAACGDSGGGDGNGGSAAGSCTPTSTVTVGALDKLVFDDDAYSAESGCIEFEYRNEGSVAHTLLIKGQSGFKLSVGKTDSGTLELEPGTYTLFCDIAGHEAAGMAAELTVS